MNSESGSVLEVATKFKKKMEGFMIIHQIPYS